MPKYIKIQDEDYEKVLNLLTACSIPANGISLIHELIRSEIAYQLSHYNFPDLDRLNEEQYNMLIDQVTMQSARLFVNNHALTDTITKNIADWLDYNLS